MAPDAQRICVLRVVCREEFSMQSAESLVKDLKQALAWLDSHFIYTPQQLKALQAKWQGVAQRAVKARSHLSTMALSTRPPMGLVLSGFCVTLA